MRPFNRFASSSALVLAALVGCNLHSGSGLDPDEIVEGGASGNSSGSGGGSGGGSGSSSGGSGLPGTDAGFNSSGSSGSSSGGGGATCSTMGPVGCVACCQNQFPGGLGYENALHACLCGGSVCASACSGDVCAGQAFSSASAVCQGCAVSQGCYMTTEQSCASDPSCQQFQSCTGSCPNNGTGGGSGGGSGSSSGGGPADASSPLDSGPSSCASNPSNCIECCGAQDPSGYKIFLGDVAQCLCTGTGACLGPCKSELCGPTMTYSPQDACGQCVAQNTKQGTTCYNQIETACAGNPTCAQFGSCYLGCPAGSM